MLNARVSACNVGSVLSRCSTDCRISQSVANGWSFVHSAAFRLVVIRSGPAARTRSMGSSRRLGVPRPARTRPVTVREASSKHTSSSLPRRFPSALVTVAFCRSDTPSAAGASTGRSGQLSARRSTCPSADWMAVADTGPSSRPVARSMSWSCRLSGRSCTPRTRPRKLPKTSATPPSRISSRRPVGSGRAMGATAKGTATPPGRRIITRPAAAMATTQPPMMMMAASVRSMPHGIMTERRSGLRQVATAESDQRQELMQQGAGEERGEFPMVVLGQHLNEVESNEVDAAQTADEAQRVAAAWPANLRRSGAGSEPWVDEVDIERQEHRASADPLAHLREHLVNATTQQLLGRNQVKAQCPSRAPVLGAVQRPADPELHRPPGGAQPFFDRPLAPGSMGITLAPVAVPGVGVRVEIDQSDPAMPLRHRTELTQRDAMVASNGKRDDAGLENRTQTLDDHRVARLDIARNHGKIAGVHHREVIEDLDLVLDVVGTQQAGRFPDRRRAESAADPVADAGVERNANDGRIDAIHVGHLR